MFKFELRAIPKHAILIQLKKMGQCYEGRIPIKENQVNLDLTLLGGQSFRWRKVKSEEHTKAPEWKGVACDAFWILKQSPKAISYKVYPATVATDVPTTSKDFESLLQRYLRTDFDLAAHVTQWKEAHEHFARIAADTKAVRVLDQPPLETILSFICSQNNHIKRISNMIDWMCTKYGQLIGHFDGRAEFAFPALAALVEHQQELESHLRAAKFGYRAKYIAQTVAKIAEFGGATWLASLRQLPYAEARLRLATLPGIGLKVADCISLMSLGHLEAVPIDTHIFKIAQSDYLSHLANVKSVTPTIYNEIAGHFREVYGPAAGWAQAVLFCSDLQQFQRQAEGVTTACGQAQKRKK